MITRKSSRLFVARSTAFRPSGICAIALASATGNAHAAAVLGLPDVNATGCYTAFNAQNQIFDGRCNTVRTDVNSLIWGPVGPAGGAIGYNGRGSGGTGGGIDGVFSASASASLSWGTADIYDSMTFGPGLPTYSGWRSANMSVTINSLSVGGSYNPAGPVASLNVSCSGGFSSVFSVDAAGVLFTMSGADVLQPRLRLFGPGLGPSGLAFTTSQVPLSQGSYSFSLDMNTSSLSLGNVSAGYQLALVPAPASCGVLALGLMGHGRRRRARA